MEKPFSIQKFAPRVLHQYIERFNVYRFAQDVDVQLFPKGVFEIVFQSHNHFQHHTSYSSGWRTRPKCFIGGLHSKAYNLKSEGHGNYCITVEFKANTAKYFIPCHLHEFQNNLVEIYELWGNTALDLAQKIYNEKSDAGKVNQLENFLLSKFIPQRASVIDQVLKDVFDTNGFVEVNTLAEKATLSAAQFRKRFKEEIGIAPSQYCKIVRINTAMNFFEKGYKKSLTELAHLLGYFDQAHFIRDFKSVAGSSPKKYQAFGAF